MRKLPISNTALLGMICPAFCKQIQIPRPLGCVCMCSGQVTMVTQVSICALCIKMQRISRVLWWNLAWLGTPCRWNEGCPWGLGVWVQLLVSSATEAAKDTTWRVLITDCNIISHTSSHSEKHPLWMASQEHMFILEWEPISGGCLDVDTHFSGLWGVEQNERMCLAP